MEPVLDDSYEGMEELAAKTLRPPQRISAEDLIASELANAVLSDPVQKIRHVCEALMFLDESERKQARITDDEVKEAEKLYRLAITFLNVATDQVIASDGRKIDVAATIQWPFGEQEAGEWEKWLTPPGVTIQWFGLNENEGNEIEAAVQKTKSLGERNFIYTQGRKLTLDSVFAFKTHFTVNAMPTAARLMKKIMALISPDSYQRALQIMRGGRRGKSQA